MKKILFLTYLFILPLTVFGQKESKNTVGISFGLVAWDGTMVDLMDYYKLQYAYQIHKKIKIVVKYLNGSSESKMSSIVYDEKEFLNSRFIANENTSQDPSIMYFEYLSYGLGTNIRINRDIKSSILLYLGVRQVIINEKSFSSYGTDLEYYRDLFYRQSKLGWELGLSYDYRINDIISVNSSASFVSNTFLWEISVGCDVWF